MTTRTHRPSPQESERLADVFASDDLDLSRASVWTDPRLEQLLQGVQARASAEQTILDGVRSARAEGTPWAMIAGVLGVSHQAAMKRFKPLLADPQGTP
jgi:hypothetical protein